MTLSALQQENDEVIDVSAQTLTLLCKAMADKLRLQILRLLKNESFAVLELCRILTIKQSALSHHLKILATAQLVSTRREGNTIFYRRVLVLQQDPFADLKRSVFAKVDQLELSQSLLQSIELIQQERAQLSLSYFRKNADKFLEQQGLITTLRDYEANLDDLISNNSNGAATRVMEVGPGEGELLLVLAKRFESTLALDNSKVMLDRSRLTLAGAGQTNVDFILGDTQLAREKNIRCDLLIFNMVLHHISSPANTFVDAASLLNPGGSLLIVDLNSHDQDWVREGCGDLWLGFDSQDLDEWASKAGLLQGQNLYLGLRNGFQIQMRVFKNEG